ncbi:MAG: hypothetical protein AAF587_25815 [Bacteroidota bacterium]
MKFHIFILLCISCLLFASSCEEVINAGGVQILVFKHKLVPDSLQTAFIRGMVLDETASHRDGTVLWGKIPNNDPNYFNDVILRDAPAPNDRFLQIRVNNNVAGERGLTGVLIELSGDITPGVTLTTGRAELYFGEGQEDVYATDAGNSDDTYFELTITDLDEEEKRIKAEFHFLLDNIADPEDHDRVSVMDGSLNMSYTE